MDSVVRALIRVLAAVDRINTRLEDFPDRLDTESSLVQGLLDAQGEALFLLQQASPEERNGLRAGILALREEEVQAAGRPAMLFFYDQLLDPLGLPEAPGGWSWPEDGDVEPDAAADRPRD
jgi:hypothetical protein